ncbi:hypothetical protein [Ulvibacter antarcticus]|uniref:NlpE-like protein n=1 Tax=Ulvibacter antarcticus TaxID=442714 RepID=A0A3L9Z1D0_9FLAO|nr:hypothetical protein [Ulvibacter antarcticus]RMA65827.1 hypothetical protein BXY75_0240 [Ulvibacter antarcticus]
MKKIILLVAVSIATFSCKNAEEKNNEVEATVTEATADQQMYRGEFLYMADAAVLKGDNFIYGVTLDDMSQELANRVKAVKKDDFDMVPVIVNGIVKNKEAGVEGWDEVITITEILHISDKPSEADIKIEEKKS